MFPDDNSIKRMIIIKMSEISGIDEDTLSKQLTIGRGKKSLLPKWFIAKFQTLVKRFYDMMLVKLIMGINSKIKFIPYGYGARLSNSINDTFIENREALRDSEIGSLSTLLTDWREDIINGRAVELTGPKSKMESSIDSKMNKLDNIAMLDQIQKIGSILNVPSEDIKVAYENYNQQIPEKDSNGDCDDSKCEGKMPNIGNILTKAVAQAINNSIGLAKYVPPNRGLSDALQGLMGQTEQGGGRSKKLRTKKIKFNKQKKAKKNTRKFKVIKRKLKTRRR